MYGYVWDGIYQYSDFNLNPDGSMTLKPGVADLSGRLGTSTKIDAGYVKYKNLDDDININTGFRRQPFYGCTSNMFNADN